MSRRSSIAFAVAGCVVTVAGAGYLTARLNGPDRSIFLPGKTTHGHYQIELACDACHDVGMGVREASCVDCHGASLRAADDSHPRSKFTDPRNADRVAVLDARNCVTCHREHQPSITRAMGVTLPEDYCYHCHQQTLTDRPSHRDFTFDSCATAGCHNYHDNTALYEAFLLKHAAEPDLKEPAVRPVRDSPIRTGSTRDGPVWVPLTLGDADGPAGTATNLLQVWASTAHGRAGVNCTGCHLGSAAEAAANRWVNRPRHTDCAACHRGEVDGLLGGRHGMRLAAGLEVMTPELARLPMKAAAGHRKVNCVSCHGAHEMDTRTAAVDACLGCHDDRHSRTYRESPHFALWQKELAGAGPPGSGVSCATCHLPRKRDRDGELVRVRVEHNQNANLRPNEKMIRTVCLDCHGLGFSLDALADRGLIQNNFSGRPAAHIESIDLAMRRQLEQQKPSINPKSKSKP